MDFGKTETVYV